MKICIIEGKRPSLFPEGPEIEKTVLGPDVTIDLLGEFPHYKISSLKEYDAVIIRPGTPFGPEHINNLEKAKVIVALGVGFDHIDLEAATKKNIPVCNVPDYGTEEVADTAVAMILNLHRKISKYYFTLNEKDISWDWKILEKIKRCSETQVGIIGLGRIGTAVALRLKAFNFNISYYDPYLPRGFSKSLGIKRVEDIKELLSTSDIISIHTPLNIETSGMINDQFLNIMKDDAILVNCSRGKILSDLNILLKHLEKKSHFRVGLDVLPEEPPTTQQIFSEWKKNNHELGHRLIINPHSAFYSLSAVLEIRKFAAEIVAHIFSGKKPYNKVSLL